MTNRRPKLADLKEPNSHGSRQVEVAGITKDLSIDDLKTELHRREVEKKEKRAKALLDLQMRQAKALTMEFIDVFLPQHGRTSCSDKNTINGWGSNSMTDPPRCNRCAAIELMNNTIPDGEFILRLSIEQAGTLEKL